MRRGGAAAAACVGRRKARRYGRVACPTPSIREPLFAHSSFLLPLVASSIAALRADVLGLQEPSPTQAAHLRADLGPAWGVAVAACDPQAWSVAGPSGPAEGQKRDGNGVAWRRDRLRLCSRWTSSPCRATRHSSALASWRACLTARRAASSVCAARTLTTRVATSRSAAALPGARRRHSSWRARAPSWSAARRCARRARDGRLHAAAGLESGRRPRPALSSAHHPLATRCACSPTLTYPDLPLTRVC